MHTYYRFNGRIAHPSAKLLLQHLLRERLAFHSV